MEEKVALHTNSTAQTLVDRKIKLTESNAFLLLTAAYQAPHEVHRTVSDTIRLVTILTLGVTDETRNTERAGFQLTLPIIVVSFLACHYFMEIKISTVKEGY